MEFPTSTGFRAVLVLAVALAGTPAVAADSVTLSLAVHSVNIDAFDRHVGSFLDRVKEVTKGAVELKLYGVSEVSRAAQTVDDLRSGKIDAFAFAGSAGRFPFLEVSRFPGSYTSIGLYRAAFQETLRREYSAAFRAAGLELLAGAAIPRVDVLFSTKPIERANDLNGLKIRTTGYFTREVATALGAQPVGIPYADIPMAFSAGQVDSAMTYIGSADPLAALLSSASNVKYVYAWPGAKVAPWSLVVNAAVWNNRVPQEARERLAEAFAEFEKTAFDVAKDLEHGLPGKVGTELKKRDIQWHTLPTDAIYRLTTTDLPDKFKSAVLGDFNKLAGPGGRTSVNRILDRSLYNYQTKILDLRLVENPWHAASRPTPEMFMSVPLSGRYLSSIDLGRDSAASGGSGAVPSLTAGVHWNIWADKGTTARYQPQAALEKGKDYTIVVDLSAIPYLDVDIVTTPASNDLQTEVARWKADEGLSTAELKVLLIPDPVFFEPPSVQEEDIQINLERVRKTLGSYIALKRPPLEELKNGNGDALFRYGRVAFKLRTLDPMPAGRPTVALSIWSDRRPVQEIAVSFCAEGTPCRIAQTARSLDGIDSARLAGENAGAKPDAAFHFIEMEDGPVWAVFRDHTATLPVTKPWVLQNTGADLAKDLADLTKLMGQNASRTNLAAQGTAMFNLLLPDVSTPGKEARNAFKIFAGSRMAGSPFAADAQAPTLFIRFVPRGAGKRYLFPLGMMTIPVNGVHKFIGEYFRIETPMPAQSYQPAPKCLKSWMVVGPPETGGGALASARVSLAAKARIAVAPGGFQFGDKRLPIITNMDDFINEITKDDPIAEPTLLSILSHHELDAVFFESGTRVNANAISRRFAAPSAVLLNGCGTVRPGAAAFIRQLNLRGIQAAIATVTEVDGDTAGTFLDCFARGIESAKKNNTGPPTLAAAYADAVKCTYATHKEKALWYSLIGNGSLTLCLPD